MRTIIGMLLPVLLCSFLSAREVFAQQASSLAEIQKAIEESGARWTARETPFTNLSPEEKQKLCGAAWENPEGQWYEPEEGRQVPAILDWRDHVGHNWATAVRDQSGCGSCWAFGTIAALEAMYGVVRNDPFIQLDLSEQFMVSCSMGSCSGFNSSGAQAFLESTGAPDENCYPYAADDLSCEDACEDWEQRVYKTADWEWVSNNPEIIKSALLEGPMTVRFEVWDDFMSYSGGVYEYVWGDFAGGHIVGLYGYNSEHNPPYWICKNSWGTDWGMDGWFYIAWGEVGINDQVTKQTLDVNCILEGVVTNAQTGGSVADARVDILETGQHTDTGEDGSYMIGCLSEFVTVVVSHCAFSADTSDMMVLGDTPVVYNADISPLPTSFISGQVYDSVNTVGVQSQVVVSMNGAPFDTVLTDGTGNYEFSGMPVSNHPYTVYTGIEVNAELPYPASTVLEEELILMEEGLDRDIQVPPARVFLIDDDEGGEYEDYYTPEIAAAGLSYVHFDENARDTSAVAYLSLFPPGTLVIWFTGDARENTISVGEENELRSFLNTGGRIFLTGQNIAEDLSTRNSTFLSDVIHISYVDTSDCAFHKGTAGDALGDELGTLITIGTQGASNQTSRDVLFPLDSDAHECLFYARNPADPVGEGTAGVWVGDQVSGDPDIVFFGFGFEAILSGNHNSTSRDEVLACVLGLFEMLPVGIEGQENGPNAGSALPRAFCLEQNYPNPFNPSTSIRFSVPGSAGEGVRVKLEVFNLRGQRIRCLLDETCEPGDHVVHWDGRSQNGESVQSGVYLYRVAAGEFSSVRKMVILK